MNRTIAFDFDGVIHKYSKGWGSGAIYDQPIEGALEGIKRLLKEECAVFIFSTRDSKQIKEWFDALFLDAEIHHDDVSRFETEIVPEGTKFWKKKNVVGVTNRKLAASIYFDDRAVRFTNWKDTMKYLT